MITLNKKGIIILSHYRSGATQFRNILVNSLELCLDKNRGVRDLGEIDFQENIPKIKTANQVFANSLEDTRFKVIQLNNPIVINYLYANNFFDTIFKDFEAITILRRSKSKCLLSLLLWEKFIQHGLNDNKELWTKKNMRAFHNKLIKTPISYQNIYNGVYHESLTDDTPAQFLEKKITFFLSSIVFLEQITSKYNFKTLFYEDYEFNRDYLYDSFLKDILSNCRVQDIIDSSYGWKIPYVASDYIDYFDKHTKEAFLEWGIK